MSDIEKTKVRLQEARKLAKAEFGEVGDNPIIIAAILQSLSVDSLSAAIEHEAKQIGDTICQAAAVASGS